MTAKGKIVFTLLFLAVVGFGVWKWWDKLAPKHQPYAQAPGGAVAPSGNNPTPAPAIPTKGGEGTGAQDTNVVETQTQTPRLPAALTYKPTNNTVIVALSEY